MRLYELNQDVHTFEFDRLVEQYQKEYKQREASSNLNEEELLEEGLRDWFNEKAEFGSYLKRLLRDSKKSETAGVLINKLTVRTHINPFMGKINEILKKIESILTDHAENALLQKSLGIAKKFLDGTKAKIIKIYKYFAGLSGFKKLAGSLGMSGLITYLEGKTEEFFEFIKDFSIDKIKDLILKVNVFNSISKTITQIGDKVFSAVTKVTGDLSGISTIVKIFNGIRESLSFIFSLLKAVKNKVDAPPIMVNQPSGV